jgi:asparagine synthase (glutamine-hydrolysing)
MCGIAGLLHFDREREVDAGVLDRMTDILAHRGPDGRGTHREGPVGLGHRRLAIIDLSPEASQPLCNEDGTVWVVANGEIYNFVELREELEAKGHVFRSRTDSEVLVHLYEEEGERLVERLRGMFAFAIWDSRQGRLLLARDRFGQKPLYYHLGADGVRFGSEIKAIVQDPDVPRAPDLRALDAYLTYGYVPGPWSAFQGIRRLPPGHVLTVSGDGQHDLRRYWSLDLAPKLEGAEAAPARVEARLLELLDEAVRLRMVSDVPLGAFLSGGLDSSAIVASMCATSEGGPASVRTYSIGFAEGAFDETAYAAEVAQHLGTTHEKLVLTRDAFAELERIAWHYGEPFADSSCLPTFAVSALARRHVTVVLSGDGGDELFCGYNRYVGTRAEMRVREAPTALRLAARNRVLIELLRRAGHAQLSGELAHGRASTSLGPSDYYLTRIQHHAPSMKRELYGERLQPILRQQDAGDIMRRAIAASNGETFTERCAHADAITYLPDDILVKVDVASMAHGLECRSPLLDHVLAEFVGRIPYRQKMRRLETKLALRRAVGPRLPRSVLERSKMGFGIPLDRWLRDGLSRQVRETLLAPEADRGYVRRPVVERLLAEHQAGRVNHQNHLFTL